MFFLSILLHEVIFSLTVIVIEFEQINKKNIYIYTYIIIYVFE